MNLHRLSFITSIFLILCCKTEGAKTAGDKPPAFDTYYIKAQIKGLPLKPIYLASVYGDELKKIDSTVCDSGGNIQLKIAANMPVGIYRLLLGKTYKADFSGSEENNIDIIFNHENIKFSTVFNQLIDSINVSESTENQLYYDFFHTLKHQYQGRLDILSQSLRYYPRSDAFYEEMDKHFHKVLQDEQNYADDFLAKNANSIAARIIKVQQKPSYFKFFEATEKMTDAERIEYMKQHFLDDVDFSDSLILHTALIPDKIMAFLSLYRDKQATSEQQAEEYKKAADALVSKAKINDAVYNYVLTYITKGFEKIGEEDVVIYISDKYLATSCSNDKLKDEYLGKTEKMKKLAIGQQAPDIEMNDINGKPVKLSGINAEHTLVLFWASWCPHCTDMLPKLKAVYETINNGQPHKKLEVFAFSIDADSTAWKKFVNDGKYNWINCSELKGWDSKTAKQYNVYGTPTMLLLDKGMKIVGKPITLSELEQEIKTF